MYGPPSTMSGGAGAGVAFSFERPRGSYLTTTKPTLVSLSVAEMGLVAEAVFREKNSSFFRCCSLHKV